MKSLHLVCNAHLDPVWLWEWEEGVAAAISTFRTAADLCEEFDGFVFNHNEVILYEWVRDHEPALFERIQRLVSEGKWHIMGGWFLQPDCNMPSGESFVRQILVGREYFKRHFGAVPTTAINFDPFGHTRGLVQILAKSGYTSYLHCRPHEELWSQPNDDYLWVGYDGSTVLGHRANTFYNAPLGKAREKVEKYITDHPDRETGLVLWGVGNHGGGPSRQDIAAINELIAQTGDFQIVHSTPEAYFATVDPAAIPRHEADINAIFRGCYTSQVRIKQKHRKLENELYATEKMRAAAALLCGLPYPAAELAEALRDLLTAEFHDILPGSSIQPVEEQGMRILDHGIEIISRLKARAFFSLASGQPKAGENEIPVLAYNPHPYPVFGTFVCEFGIADFNWDKAIESHLTLFHNGQEIPCQVEKEYANVPVDWRKRLVFDATLPPSQMSRFDCKVEMLPKPEKAPYAGDLVFDNGRLVVVVNPKTGLVDRYAVDGVDLLAKGAFKPLVVRDIEDAWGEMEKSFREVVGEFELMSPEDGTAVSGHEGDPLPAVRVIEDGPVRTVVESLLAYGRSYIRIGYAIPKNGTEMQVQVRAHWQESRRYLKLSIPTTLEGAEYLGQVAYGVERLPANGDEAVAQKWVAAACPKRGQALSVINDGIYGSDFLNGEIRMSLLRSPAYSSMVIPERTPKGLDRFQPRIDVGMREYRFWINGGKLDARLEQIDREAMAHNEEPTLISFFPNGDGTLPGPLVAVDDPAVQMTCFKAAENGEGYIVRLFEPTGKARKVKLSFPALAVEETIALSAFEVQTLRINPTTKTVTPVSMTEE
ncbi:MAG: glycoside hydrolase family 38 C-terminal domain-containing protein [FCB group bacterium]|jgi:alpha-mannosidase|nr:glycoside hydrolase family 38 C-terminal domain-containing protein [FCB group bacterium]